MPNSTISNAPTLFKQRILEVRRKQYQIAALMNKSLFATSKRVRTCCDELRQFQTGAVSAVSSTEFEAFAKKAKMPFSGVAHMVPFSSVWHLWPSSVRSRHLLAATNGSQSRRTRATGGEVIKETIECLWEQQRQKNRMKYCRVGLVLGSKMIHEHETTTQRYTY